VGGTGSVIYTKVGRFDNNNRSECDNTISIAKSKKEVRQLGIDNTNDLTIWIETVGKDFLLHP